MMPKYTEAQWTILTNANTVDVAHALGLEIDEKGSDRKAYHIVGHGGLFVWKDGSGFYHSSENKKGNAVDLVRHILGSNYREALDFINDNVMNGSCTPPERSEVSRREPEKSDKQPFNVPKREPSAKRAYAYLIQTRKIDPEIVKTMVTKGAIAQEAAHGNVCFIGFDKSGSPRYCALRGTVTDKPFKGEVSGSDKNYGFCIHGQSKRLIVFEAAIDALSFATLENIGHKGAWQTDTKLALGGCAIKALEQHLKDYPGCYNEIIVATDNDAPGNKFAEVIMKEYGKEFNVTRRCPFAKDWNEDLVNIKKLFEEHHAEWAFSSPRNAVTSYYARQKMTETPPEEYDEIEV